MVEVGLTHESKEKYLSYRDKGVVEFWQLNTRPRKQGGRIVAVTFLDLQAASVPLEINASLNLPDVTSAHVIRFIRTQSGKVLDNYEMIDAVRDLLEKDAREIREEAEEYELAG